MSSALIPAIQRALQRRAWASLRFNFRGVGLSEGRYDDGVGETDDVRAALSYLAGEVGAIPLAIVGWSFGALVGLTAAATDMRVSAFAGVAPPLTVGAGIQIPSVPSADLLRRWNARVFLTCGTNDPFCSPADLRAWATERFARADVRVFEGQDHFFSTARDELSDAVACFITEVN